MVATSVLLSLEEPRHAIATEDFCLLGQSFIPEGQANRPVGNTAPGLMVPTGSRAAIVSGLAIGGLLLPFALLVDLARTATRALSRRQRAEAATATGTAVVEAI